MRGTICERWELHMLPHRVEFHAARPKWELGRLQSCAETMRPGKIVWDIGAEEGDFTALYGQWVISEGFGGVVAIEPQPGYWPAIRHTWEMNHTVKLKGWFPGFASDMTELVNNAALTATGWWEAIDWPRAWTQRKVVPDIGFKHLAYHTDHVPQTRIDDFAEFLGHEPDIIVIDVEGAEVNVIQGLRRLNNKPLVYVSVHEPTMWNWYQKTLDDLKSEAKNLSYEATELPHNGEGETFWLLHP